MALASAIVMPIRYDVFLLALCYRKSQHKIIFCECCSCMHSHSRLSFWCERKAPYWVTDKSCKKKKWKNSTAKHKHKVHVSCKYKSTVDIIGFLIENLISEKKCQNKTKKKYCAPPNFIKTKICKKIYWRTIWSAVICTKSPKANGHTQWENSILNRAESRTERKSLYFEFDMHGLRKIGRLNWNVLGETNRAKKKNLSCTQTQTHLYFNDPERKIETNFLEMSQQQP